VSDTSPEKVVDDASDRSLPFLMETKGYSFKRDFNFCEAASSESSSSWRPRNFQRTAAAEEEEEVSERLRPMHNECARRLFHFLRRENYGSGWSGSPRRS